MRCAKFKLILVSIWIIISFIPVTACHSQEVKVMRVIDGDTIKISGGSKVRYIGIDTPELDECYGKEATNKNRELVDGNIIQMEEDVSNTDKYGRLLRYVYVDDLLVNGELVRLGYARVVTYYPDIKYHPLLNRLEREARDSLRGLWSACLESK